MALMVVETVYLISAEIRTHSNYQAMFVICTHLFAQQHAVQNTQVGELK